MAWESGFASFVRNEGTWDSWAFYLVSTGGIIKFFMNLSINYQAFSPKYQIMRGKRVKASESRTLKREGDQSESMRRRG